MAHKKYFKKKTPGEILTSCSPTSNKSGKLKIANQNIIKNIIHLGNPNHGLIIPSDIDIVPTRYNPRKFMKHGNEVKIKRYRTIDDLLVGRDEPVKVREESFEKMRGNFYCGYSFMPVVGKDRRKRKVPLVECMEGAKIFTYSENGPKIKIHAYDDSFRVDKEGAEIIASVPSRMEKDPRHEFKFSSVPVKDNKNKWRIAYELATDHNCGSKRFNIRYRYMDDKESSKVFNFCSHEIAAYLKITDHYLKNEKNHVPLQMSQFAIPTQETADFYTNMDNSCLKEYIDDKGKTKLRNLNRAEKEILLWNYVKQEGHDKTFFATDKLKDYDWGVI
jgi:hypothetical protein